LAHLCLELTLTGETGTGSQVANAAAPSIPVMQGVATEVEGGRKILRFYESERLLHWAIVIPFLVCYLTAVIMLVVYNPDPTRPYRMFFSWLHRISGVCLVVLPISTLFRGRKELRIHLHNIRHASTWLRDDFKWLLLMLPAAWNSKMKLPVQGKFNAAEKINFLVLLGSYPLYIATGALMWMKYFNVLSWFVHITLAAIATPLILGHIYMAVINKGSRPGLPGMLSGFVDRQWAKHHYANWYGELYEPEQAAPAGEEVETTDAVEAGVAQGSYPYEA